MPPIDRLHILLLSALDGQKEPVTRYEAMNIVNKAASQIDKPYSPGAVYHAIKRLGAEKMINFNQEMISISPEGAQALESHLLHTPIPESTAALLYIVFSTCLLTNKTLQKKSLSRLQVELIKFNQYNESASVFDSKLSALNLATNICRKHISVALKKIVLDLGD